MNKTNVLITGASGSVGKEALDMLLKQENIYNVTVIDIKNKKTEKFYNKYNNKINLFYADISDKESTKKACANQDFVIHLAALIPPAAYKNKVLTEKINTLGTKNLIENLEQLSPNAFFAYSSSVANYGDRLENPYIKVTDELKPSMNDFYAETKIKAEKIIIKCNLNWTIFRLSAIMGAGNHKISGLMFLMPLSTPIEITTPKDTARAFVNAIDHKEKLNKSIFNLGGGEENRIIYEDLLKKSFEIYGLGKLNFPQKAFANFNYHCAYYEDSDKLEEILKFRQDNISTYFEKVKKTVPKIQYIATKIVSSIAKYYLLKQSDPWKAYKQNDLNKMKYYFKEYKNS